MAISKAAKVPAHHSERLETIYCHKTTRLAIQSISMNESYYRP